jgi:hypothetical protein
MIPKRLLGVLCTLVVATSLTAASFERQELVLSNANSTTAQATVNTPLLKGESGFIVRNFGANEMIIVSRAIVTQSTKTTANFVFAPYNGANQSSLPTFSTLPQNGDKLIIHPFGKRSLILAPNFETYQKTAALMSSEDVIHPDHFATYLLSHYNPTPKKEDIQNFCENYSVEFLYIASTNGSLQIRDCGSLQLLENKEVTSTRGATSADVLPFYHRVSEIKRGLFDFGPKSIEKFDPYYSKLFEDKK